MAFLSSGESSARPPRALSISLVIGLIYSVLAIAPASALPGTSDGGSGSSTTEESSSVPARETLAPATLTSDKSDYLPGETVILTGAGFAPDSTVTVVVDDGPDDEFTRPWRYEGTDQTDASGGFVHSLTLPDWFVAMYVATATDTAGNSATTTFTDVSSSLSNDFKQCANDDPTSPIAPNHNGACHWINSILQNSNGDYVEGLVIPQRVVLPSVPASSGNKHTLLFSHLATKGQGSPAHAYDFISSWADARQTAADLGVFSNLKLNVCGVAIAAGAQSACQDVVTIDGSGDPVAAAGAYSINVPVPDDPYVSDVYTQGDGDYQDRINAYESQYGDRYIQIFGNAPFTDATLSLSHVEPQGSDDANDDAIEYTLNWTSASTKVVVAMGGHLAIGKDGTAKGWGPGVGASGISGGPYHFYLNGYRFFDPTEVETPVDLPEFISLGNQDNQIKAADIFAPGFKDGMKFNDLDADGAKDAGEPGLSGWTINLYRDLDDDNVLDAGEPVERSDVTDTNGYYSLFPIPFDDPDTSADEGDYIVCESLEANWVNSYPNAGTTLPAGEQLADCGANGKGYAFHVTDAEIFEGNDFGNYSFATKTGTKYEDKDADGVKDGDETGLSGWTIRVYADANGDGDLDNTGEFAAGPVFATTTDANGDYSFPSLIPGTKYIVCEVAQGGWQQSGPAGAGMTGICDVPSVADGLGPNGYAIQLTPGQVDSGNDFGNYRPASKSGTKFNDLDADGVKDGGEPGVSGLTIKLLNAAGTTVVATTTTDASGNYSFTGITPGSYLVCEYPAAGWIQSYPANSVCSGVTGAAPGGWAITLSSGEQDTNNNFGNYQTASKSGTKFEDLDADGVKDAGEPGVQGVTIRLYNAAGTTLLASTTTNASGNYSFTGITPGSYLVCEVVPSGWTQSYPANSACSGVSGAGAGGWAITLTSGQSDTGNDFGNWKPGTKAGTKFDDLDADGVIDAGEPGLSGWKIEAFEDDNKDGVKDAGEIAAPDASDTTDSNGDYLLTLDPGKYWVCEEPQAGWTQSYPSNTVCAGIAGSAAGGYYITITSREEEVDNDFANWTTASKSGMKFHDLDADGVKDAGEPGLENWRIYVDYDGDNAYDAGEPTDLTDATGAYLITGINPGTYDVREVLQSGWSCSYPNPGAPDPVTGVVASTDCEHTETFASGSSFTDNNFGNWTTATKSGVKFEDLDADGSNQEAGEPGLPGWTIWVDYDNDGNVDAGEPSAVTGAGGAYTITGIVPGTWRVKEVLQAGWTCSYPSPCYHEETFTSGAELRNNNFGNWTTASKSGMKFHDLDADGVKDAGEPGLENWRIYVDYDGDNAYDAGEPTDLTDATGAYLITGINPGTYDVREVLQSGWSCSYPNPGAPDPVTGVVASTDCEHTETFASGSSFTDNNFGNWTTATKSGVKFEDLDADGSNQEAGEPGLPGWTIWVDYDNDGNVDAGEPSAVTGAGGAYTITGIVPGTWRVKEVLQAGWTCSYPSPCYHEETFTSGAELRNNNFGNWTTASKSGMKFHDLDADGEPREAGEPGLVGWTIYVDYDNDSNLDAGEPFAVTGLDGSYTINGITPGTWYVREVGQTDWYCSFPDPCRYHETFTSREAVTGNDFGNYQKVKVRVHKTVQGLAPTADDPSFRFELRSGASQASVGTTLGYEFANAANGGNVVFTTPSDHDGVLEAGEAEIMLDPGTYALCEFVPLGWDTSLRQFDSDGDGTPGEFGDDWYVPGAGSNSEFDNTYVCVNFTVTSGDDVVTINVDNTRPGMARTIGYWKNWNSCSASKGKQRSVLDLTIANKADNSGGLSTVDIRIGDLFVEDNPATSGVNEGCTLAVDILDKRKTADPIKIKDGAKAASDPAHNMAAQLMGFELNTLAELGSCAKATAAADIARRYLDWMNFDGNTHANLSPQDKANLNYLEGILDSYNNNTLACGGAVTVPYPAELAKLPAAPYDS
jgi:protocatechuate 3,4-dioxygenase beta subunit